MRAGAGEASTITPRWRFPPTAFSSRSGWRFPPRERKSARSSKNLPYPRVTDPEAPPIRPQRHQPGSIATLREALGRLPDRDRMLLTMKYLDGMDYRAIGAALDLNPESIGQFLHRAKQKLATEVPHLRPFLAETVDRE